MKPLRTVASCYNHVMLPRPVFVQFDILEQTTEHNTAFILLSTHPPGWLRLEFHFDSVIPYS